MITINWHPSPREMRQWAGLLAVALGLVGSLFYFLEWGIFRGGEGLAKFLWAFGAVAFLTGATGSKAGLPAYWAWMGFVYAVLIGRDRLQIRSAARTSYWHSLDVAPSHHPERQF
jgi:hypothetical protein